MYTVEITKTSRELSPKERVAIKNGSAKKLDELTQNGEFIITPVGYAILKVNNDKSADKTYEQYVVFDISGDKYVTGSKSFFDAFLNIYTELNDENGTQIEEYSLRVFRKPSRNYAGKEFITCEVL